LQLEVAAEHTGDKGRPFGSLDIGLDAEGEVLLGKWSWASRPATRRFPWNTPHGEDVNLTTYAGGSTVPLQIAISAIDGMMCRVVTEFASFARFNSEAGRVISEVYW